MKIPVYVPDWMIGDGSIQPPAPGMAFEHVLGFYELPPEQATDRERLAVEVTVKGVAEWLRDQECRAAKAFPTAIRGVGFTLYWEAPAVVEGPVTLTGIIQATGPDAAPEGFPAVSGVIASLESISFLPAGAEYIDTDEPGSSMGLVLQLELDSAAVRGAIAEADVDDSRSFGADGSPVRIRIFPDYAKTVLWLFGPLAYDDAGLSPLLATDLAAWEESYYASLDSNDSWKSPLAAAQFTATGKALAERLAAEVGRDFEVEFHSYEPGSRREIFHSDRVAANPAAANALHSVVAGEKEERARLAALSSESAGGWFAYAPRSGAVFNPGGTAR